MQVLEESNILNRKASILTPKNLVLKVKYEQTIHLESLYLEILEMLIYSQYLCFILMYSFSKVPPF